MPEEYISREKTLNLLKRLGSRDYRREKGTIQDAIKMISSAAYTPAADVAEAVRCKDCKYGSYARKPNGAMVCLRTNDGVWRKEADFCSYGEYQTNTGGVTE